MYNNTFTNNDGKLIPYYDRKAMVTYDPDDLKTVYIFDTDYNYICSAFAKLKTLQRGGLYQSRKGKACSQTVRKEVQAEAVQEYIRGRQRQNRKQP